MATLLVKGLNEQAVSEYDIASEEEKLQVKKVIEDVLDLWLHRRTKTITNTALWQEMADFIARPQTFALDWEHNRLSREEMNAR